MRNLPLKALLLLFFPSFLVAGFAQQRQFLESGNGRWADQGVTLPSPTRTVIDLDGSWNYSLENGSTGSILLPAVFDFAGTVTFERSFEIAQPLLDRYQFQLVMLGVHHACEVSLNGEYLLSHTGGYTTISQPLDKNLLQPGKDNVLRVTVNNLLDNRKTLPLRPQVWGSRNYGGIHREVFLLGTPRISVREAVITTVVTDNPAAARVTTRVAVEGATAGQGSDGQAEPLSVVVEAVDQASGMPVGRSLPVPLVRRGTEWGEISVDLVIPSPRLWRPESPDLYLLRTLVMNGPAVIDEFRQTFGVRTLAISRGDLMLNGRRLILKGVTWYEDHPSRGSALTPEDREKDVVLIKNLGANTVRFADHPPHPAMLALCDRYGLLALVEIPVVGTPGAILGEDAYQDQAASVLRELILRDRNHPSVIAWGLGDGFESSHPGARAYVQAMVALARGLDSRPLYFGSRMGSSDLCTELTDIAALSVHAEDLKGFRAQLEAWRSRFGKMPVLLSRFGKEVQGENRGGTNDPYSQQSQARYYLQRFEATRALDYDGAVLWSFNDWRGDRPSLTVHSGDPWLHSMGLVSGLREKRLAFDAVRAVFAGEKFVALPAGSYAANAPIIYVVAGFLVLIAIAYLYNRNRRFRDNLNRSVLNAYNFFADVRDQHVVSGLHSVILALIVAVTMAIVFSSILFTYRNSWTLDALLSTLLVSDVLKDWLVRLIWNPVLFILYFSVILFLGLVAATGLVLALRWVFKTRIYPFHAFSITVWSTPPFLVLIPVGMVLYRVLESSVYVLPAVILLVLLHLWVVFRLLKGMAIVFDVTPLKVYALGGFAVVAVLGLGYLYYDVLQAAPLYVSFLVHASAGAR